MLMIMMMAMVMMIIMLMMMMMMVMMMGIMNVLDYGRDDFQDWWSSNPASGGDIHSSFKLKFANLHKYRLETDLGPVILSFGNAVQWNLMEGRKMTYSSDRW